MKKFITIAGAIAVGCQLFGQGTVDFRNGNANAITNGLAGGRIVAGTAFQVALYYLPDTGQASVTTADITAGLANGTTRVISTNSAAGGTSLAAPGIFVGGVRTAPTATPGGSGWFQVRAWESAFGNSYEAAVANGSPVGGRLALVGTSNIMKVTTGNPLLSPPGTPFNIQNALQTFAVLPVPEPSVIGLGFLGIGALLLLRRRK